MVKLFKENKFTVAIGLGGLVAGAGMVLLAKGESPKWNKTFNVKTNSELRLEMERSNKKPIIAIKEEQRSKTIKHKVTPKPNDLYNIVKTDGFNSTQGSMSLTSSINGFKNSLSSWSIGQELSPTSIEEMINHYKLTYTAYSKDELQEACKRGSWIDEDQSLLRLTEVYMINTVMQLPQPKPLQETYKQCMKFADQIQKEELARNWITTENYTDKVQTVMYPIDEEWTCKQPGKDRDLCTKCCSHQLNGAGTMYNCVPNAFSAGAGKSKCEKQRNDRKQEATLSQLCSGCT